MTDMAAEKQGGSGDDGVGKEPLAWDFRLDRSGLVVKAGRHLQLRISLALLLWLIAAVSGWSAFRWGQPPLP
ncbi:hypothetical protein [Streptomyces kebangsaanensis]|uniref:hypothetical protein n=1 Tax=Streptomyces kebangsaanensis TaxID=864058 RepID=UPI000AFE0D87|nr:hypothetical protein [Streptomyces kebangsaanensis]